MDDGGLRLGFGDDVGDRVHREVYESNVEYAIYFEPALKSKQN